MWIGDFVRCHTVVRLLRERHPSRPVDVLATTMIAPAVEYMPGVRKAIVVDLPRKRIALSQQRALARSLKAEGYGQALVMPRTWKSALAPYLAGIPVRTGYAGEFRFGLINNLRWGERRLPRMVDRCAALALAPEQSHPEWPAPQLVVPPPEVLAWRERLGEAAGRRRVVAFAPGAVGPSKRWPANHYAALAQALTARGCAIWVLGSPTETSIAAEIAATDPANVRDLTGPDLRNAILGLAAADFTVSNDSGLLHVAAAIGTPTIGIFGPTSPWHWAPLNPLAGIVETAGRLPCRPCHKPRCWLGHHRCMRDIPVDRLVQETRRLLAQMPEQDVRSLPEGQA
jgi:heptosyltransferase-2